jgi:hypothetical protein
VVALLLEYKLEGIDAEAIAWHINQRFPKLPMMLLSACSEMPERILWLVDAYVIKSEMPEGLIPISNERTNGEMSPANVADGNVSRRALAHAQRIMTNRTTPATSANFTSDGHFSINTFRM